MAPICSNEDFICFLHVLYVNYVAEAVEMVRLRLCVGLCGTSPGDRTCRGAHETYESNSGNRPLTMPKVALEVS